MSRAIYFENPAQNQAIASTYTLCHANEHGQLAPVHEFNGEETVRTTCPECGEPHVLDFLEFCRIAGENFDLYGTQVLCRKCNARRYQYAKF